MQSYHGQKNAGAPDSKQGPKSGSNREAFFVDFAAKVRERVPQIPLMVTGGFRSRQSMRNALDGGACDMVGIARPATLRPEYPMTVLDNKITDAETVFPTYTVTGGGIKRHLPIKSIGAGLSSVRTSFTSPHTSQFRIILST
jgi:2,4-dienoyl-CoA reductase-like NADH-dependent reductase (Old Yellow Enzyme family)